MPTPTDVQLAAASTQHIPPYNWIPPQAQSQPLTKFLNTTSNLRDSYPFPEENLNVCAALADKVFEAFPGQEQSPHGAPLVKKPHPLSDFTHIDPEPTGPSLAIEPPPHGAPDFTKLKAKFKSGQEKQQLDDLDFLEDQGAHLNQTVAYLNRTVGPAAPGFQRLKLAFDLIVCKTYELLTAINEQVGADNVAGYNNARENYIAFLTNLDDHEPEKKQGAVDPSKGFGYGKTIKWVYIDPIIQPYLIGNTEYHFIKGATIIVKWNPHSSSNGVPINHPG